MTLLVRWTRGDVATFLVFFKVDIEYVVYQTFYGDYGYHALGGYGFICVLVGVVIYHGLGAMNTISRYGNVGMAFRGGIFDMFEFWVPYARGFPCLARFTFFIVANGIFGGLLYGNQTALP